MVRLLPTANHSGTGQGETGDVAGLGLPDSPSHLVQVPKVLPTVVPADKGLKLATVPAAGASDNSGQGREPTSPRKVGLKISSPFAKRAPDEREKTDKEVVSRSAPSESKVLARLLFESPARPC